MPRISAQPSSTRALRKDDSPRLPTAAEVKKMEPKALFALRDELYSGDWQTKRTEDPTFRALLGTVEARYDEMGGDGFKRHVLGAPAPESMSLQDVYKEVSSMNDKLRRLGHADTDRRSALLSRLDGAAEKSGVTTNVLGARLRAMLDD